MTAKLEEAYQLGWETMSTIQESIDGNKTVLSVWITPQRKDE